MAWHLIQAQTPAGIRYQDLPVDIDEDMLREVAELTGGTYFEPPITRS